MLFKTAFLTFTALFSFSAFADKVPEVKDPVEDASKVVAVIETSKGEIAFEFYPKEAPLTVKNFITLTQKGFYNGLTFHRVEPKFVIQGGDPKGNGTGGPGYNIKAEFNSHKHITGTVAMARAQDPDSAGSQFYVCLAPASFLDGKYTVFGQLIKGYSVIPKIQKGDVTKSVSIKDKEKYAKSTKLETSPDVKKSESEKSEKSEKSK